MFLDSLPIDQAQHWLVTWGFEGDAFEALRAYAEEVSFPARATIFSAGDPADGMYLVLSGMALVFLKDDQGTERTIGIVTEGQSFGELGLLIGKPRHATVTAGLDVKLLKITPDTLEKLEQEQPSLVMKMYKALAQSLAEQWIRGGPWEEQQQKVKTS
ncbi:MAG: cyclic nucleotide-binding domain-containing protein [Anaerolineae bacterium]|jgi:CRP-like cAMP-binding protein|nr:cyclic nucleotide-binding domain-containing protein [Anaerolineae bacterium]